LTAVFQNIYFRIRIRLTIIKYIEFGSLPLQFGSSKASNHIYFDDNDEIINDKKRKNKGLKKNKKRKIESFVFPKVDYSIKRVMEANVYLNQCGDFLRVVGVGPSSRLFPHETAMVVKMGVLGVEADPPPTLPPPPFEVPRTVSSLGHLVSGSVEGVEKENVEGEGEGGEGKVGGEGEAAFALSESAITLGHLLGKPEGVHAKYWNQRFRLLSRFDHGVRLDQESWFSITPEPIAKHISRRCMRGAKRQSVHIDWVIDCFSGCGGNLIALAKDFAHVVGVDIDPVKIDNLK
jgi:hypothetical protein